tara:strand:+ start:1555 stop:1683 length:129 start_codon:yes stop_codon:yes gene_type:complete
MEAKKIEEITESCYEWGNYEDSYFFAGVVLGDSVLDVVMSLN